jgi:hypothetical protein
MPDGWKDILDTAVSKDRQFELFVMLADWLALTSDIAPGKVMTFEEVSPRQMSKQLVQSRAQCHECMDNVRATVRR